MPHADTKRATVSADEFEALFRKVSAWGRWGSEDERGALRNLGREQVAAAAGHELVAAYGGWHGPWEAS
jgi:hypothetical protein